MSATRLPSLPPTPATTPTSAPRASSRGPSDGASFNSHLQSAQHQQQPAADPNAQNSNASPSASNAQDATTQAANSPAAGTAKPGDSSATDASQESNSGSAIGIDLTGGIGTLASAVLSLIDHATGDTHGTGSANGAPSKPAAQANTKPSANAQPTLPAAGIVPLPLPPLAVVASNAVPAASANGTTQPASTSKSVDNALSSSLFAGANTDNAMNGDTGNAPLTADAAATDGGVQAFAASLAAATHTSAPAANALTPDSNASSTPDLSALGNLTATAPSVPAGATAGSAHNLSMDAPVGSSGFAKELGQQITWISGQDVKQAQIRLNPQDLGPLDVKVSVEHGRVDVAFMTQHPAATAAVQQSLDQLHQMLGGQGLSLGQATVGQHAQQQFGAQHGQQAQASAGSGAADETADTPVAVATRVAVGLVDAFA